MQNSADSTGSSSRPVIIYIIVAVVLFAALILGLRWAKNRADYYAQQQTGTSKTQTANTNNGQGQTENPSSGTTVQPSTPQPAPSANHESQNTPSSTPSVAATGPAAPARVPSTGPEQVLLTLASLTILTFASASYWRARRRLQQLAQ